MKPIPFVYATDMERSLRWYTAVMPRATVRSESPYWSELDIDGDTLALHGAESVMAGGGAGISFVADEPLEALVTRLSRSGIEPVRAIRDEPFGRSLVLEDPDGFRLQVNEYTTP